MKILRGFCLLVASVLLIAGIAFAQGSIKVTVNGKEIASDVSPVIQNGRVLVPLRFVADALGADVNWDSSSRTAMINTDNKPYANILLADNIDFDDDKGVVIENAALGEFEKGSHEFLVYASFYNLSSGLHDLDLYVRNSKNEVISQVNQLETLHEDGVYFFVARAEFADTGKYNVECYVDGKLMGKCYLKVVPSLSDSNASVY
ncbi:MAG: copper amine oxidase N-terminal domain-containing protein [Bacillota bacterium]